MLQYPANEEGRVRLTSAQIDEISDSLDRVFAGLTDLPEGICGWRGTRAWQYMDWSVKACQRLWDAVPFDVRYRTFSR